MSTQAIDYDALAKQAGAVSSQPAGAPDYDALAKQAGAISSTPAATAPPEPKNFGNTTLDEEIPLSSYGNATMAGLQSVGRGIRDAAKGTLELFDPRVKEGETQITAGPLGRMLQSGVDTAKGAIQVPAAIHDINQSPDPAGAYAKVSQDTAGQGAGQALVAAGTEGVTEAIPKIAGTVADSTAPARQAYSRHDITKLIKPNAGDLKYGRDPAGAIVREGINANSLEDLGPKVYDKARQVGSQIDTKLQGPAAQGKTIDVSQSLSPIDDEMKAAVKNGDKGLYDRLSTLKTQLTNDWGEITPKDGPTTIAPTALKNLQMTPYDATQFKRAVGDMTKWTGTDPFENDLNQVKAKIFSNIKEQVSTAVPDVKELNSRYSDLVQAGKAIERRIPVAARSADFSLGDMGTAALAAHAGGPVAAGAVLGRKLVGSTYFKTRAAQAVSPEANVYNRPVPPPSAQPVPVGAAATAVPAQRKVVWNPNTGRPEVQFVTP